MTGDESRPASLSSSRRAFLGAAAGGVTALTGLSGCAELTGGNDGLDAPNYDQAAVADLLQRRFPRPPNVFPVDIPAERFTHHETRARELLDAVPEDPDIPNGVVAERLAQDRAELVDHLNGGPPADEPPLDRLAFWRRVRGSAASLWGTYGTAVGQYTASEFRTRYDGIRSDLYDFLTTWNHRGTEATSALAVHLVVEELVGQAERELHHNGPFPDPPEAAVFDAGEMIGGHESAAAALADARLLRRRALDNGGSTTRYRWHIGAAADEFRHGSRRRFSRDLYEDALENGRKALDNLPEQGPAATAFERARRTVRRGQHTLADAGDEWSVARSLFRAAHHQNARRTFTSIVDAIQAGDITWPADVDELRARRATAIDTTEAAWETQPRHLSVPLTEHGSGSLGVVHYLDESVDPHTIADYVGTTTYATHYAAGIPDLTAEVVDLLTEP